MPAVVLLAGQTLDTAPTMKNYLTVASRLDDLEPKLPEPRPGRAIRIALVGNATLDHLRSYVKVECFRAGLRPAEAIFAGANRGTRRPPDAYHEALNDPRG